MNVNCFESVHLKTSLATHDKIEIVNVSFWFCGTFSVRMEHFCKELTISTSIQRDCKYVCEPHCFYCIVNGV